MSLKRGIDKTVQGLIEELEKRARPVEGRDDIKGNEPSIFFPSYVVKLNSLTDKIYTCLNF